MKIKNLSLLKLAASFIALLFCTNVNAAFIESRTLQGDNGGTYTYQLYTDRLEFSLGFSNVFDMTNILFPFFNFDEVSRLSITNENFNCNISDNFYVCSGKDNQAYDSISGTFSFLPEFRSLFQFTGYNVDRNVIRAINKFDREGETFYTGTPIISAITQNAEPVNSPATIGMFALASILMLRRRLN